MQLKSYCAKFKIIILLLFFLLGWQGKAIATDYHNLKFETINVEDGLIHSSVRCIIQDSTGFMWFGTRNGADMYNGRGFRSFTVNTEIDALKLTNNVIMSFENDSKGRLFIGAGNGLNLVDFKKNQVSHLFPNNSREDYHLENIIKSIVESDSGTIWVSTRVGVSRMVESDDSIYFIHYPINGSFEHVNTMDLSFDKFGNLWMATMQGLYLFDSEHKNFRILDSHNLGGVNLAECITLCARDDGAMWVGTSQGIFLLRGNEPYRPDITFEVEDYSLLHIGQAPVSVPAKYINSIAIDKNGAVWLTTARGLAIMPWDTISDSPLNMHVYKQDPLSVFSIGSNYLTNVYIDKSGLVWIGTNDNGISVYDPYKFKFDFYSFNTGITSVNFTAISADANNNLWLGTYADGMIFYDSPNNSFYRIPQASYSAIGSIGIDKFNRVWYIVPNGRQSGLFLLQGSEQFIQNRNTQQLEPFRFSGNQIEGFKGSLALPHVVYFDDEGYLWLGTRYDGLSKFEVLNKDGNGALKLLEQYLPDYNDPTALSAQNIGDIYKHNNDTVFVGAKGGGLMLFSPATKRFFSCDIVDSARYKYPNIVFVKADMSRNIWVSTSGTGVLKFDKLNDTVYHYITELESGIIEALLVDNYNNVWISTNKGLSLVTSDNRVINYNIGHIVKGQEFNERVAVKLSDGRLVFGGTKGFNMFRVEDVEARMNRTPHKTVLTDLEINHQPAYKVLGEGYSTSHISQLTALEVNHDQNNISFEFAALSYSSSMGIQYQYKLEGYDNDWYSTNSQRPFASYNNLPGGRYVLYVRSANADGYWSPNELVVKVFIHPPFWDTSLFKVSMVLLLAMLIHLFTMYRTRRVKKHNQQLELLVRERTKLIEEQKSVLSTQADDLLEVNTVLEERQQYIEEQAEEIASQRDQLLELNATKDKLFSIIAHDLKNPFNTILGFSELLISRYQRYSDERKLQMLEMINSSTQNLYRFLENMLTWSRTQTGKMSYNPANYNLYDLIQESISILDTFAAKKGNVIKNDMDREHGIFVDKNMFQTIISNLVSNAIKYTQNGEITLTCEMRGSSIILCCADTGTGMPDGVIANLFKVSKSKSVSGTDGEAGTGLGLLLCKEFVAIHKGKIWAESIPGKGSRFYVKLKS